MKNAFAADCAAWTAGCSYGDDSSTVDNVFMSMHPEGSCSDTTYFGTSATTFRCVEPDHNGWEFSHGSCMGRCGSTCGGGTQFTGACLDHDVCVSFGHINGTPECLDEFSDATTDFQNAPDCGGVTFTVDYNWAGSTNEGACQAGWNGTRDGCDVGCQFIDSDCFL